jgi:hypothetical protein
LRYLVAGTINTLEKMNEQAKRLSGRAEDFLAEMDECAGR